MPSFLGDLVALVFLEDTYDFAVRYRIEPLRYPAAKPVQVEYFPVIVSGAG